MHFAVSMKGASLNKSWLDVCGNLLVYSVQLLSVCSYGLLSAALLILHVMHLGVQLLNEPSNETRVRVHQSLNVYWLRLLTSCTLCRIFVELQSSVGSLCSKCKCMVSFASAVNLLPAKPNAPIAEASAILGLLSLQVLLSQQLLACAHHVCQRICHQSFQSAAKHSPSVKAVSSKVLQTQIKVQQSRRYALPRATALFSADHTAVPLAIPLAIPVPL